MSERFSRPAGWDQRNDGSSVSMLHDELALERARSLGRCPACGGSIGHEDDYSRVHGFLFHATCLAPDVAAASDR
ncbi:MAG: hypothetical protein ACJ76V_16455 [Thermoleophilaceae bacterium]